MKEWLTNVKAPKFLRYLFFIAYSYYRRFITHRGDAHFTSIAFLAMIHMLLYQGIFYKLLPQLLNIKYYTILIMLFVAIQFYIWFWYHKKWRISIEEFKYISRKKQLKGGIYLFIYLAFGYFIGVEL